MIRYNFFYCIVVIYCLYSIPPAKGIGFSGNLYTDLSLLHYHQASKDSAKFSGMSVLELKAENSDKKYFKFKADIDFYLLYGEQARLYTFMFNTVSSNIPGLDLKSAPVKIDLRELFFTLYPSFADIAIGRQIINFGKGFVLSPIDIFSPVNITDLNYKRSGADVIKIKVPLGTLSGIDCITELPLDQQEHSSAVKAFTNFHDFDIDLVGIYRHKAREITVGTSFKGDIFAGIYGEYAGHFNRTTRKFYNEFMIGADYSLLSNDLLLTLEYSYNQNPTTFDEQTALSMETINRTLFRRHYLFFNTQYSINELLSVSGNFIYNIQDTAVTGTALVRYNFLQNVYLSGYIRGMYGNLNGLEIRQPDAMYAVRAEVAF